MAGHRVARLGGERDGEFVIDARDGGERIGDQIG